jgi:hypothetical protein
VLPLVLTPLFPRMLLTLPLYLTMPLIPYFLLLFSRAFE